eukprot:NODE_87_length_21893_cov_0.496559.p5 type:complete len:366 gc:universal NODE_87_length_21893_cov_0.496559:16678-15581(-)
MFSLVSFFSFNLELAKPECLNPNINFFTKGEFMFIVPPILLVFMLIMAFVFAPPLNYPYLYLKNLILKRNTKIQLPPITKEAYKSNVFLVIRGFNLLLQFIFVSLTSWALGYFNCVDFGAGQDKTLVLLKSPAYECYTGAHKDNFPFFLTATIIYVVGIPLYFTSMHIGLYQNKFKGGFATSVKSNLTRLLITDNTIFKPTTQFIVAAQLYMKLIILLVQNLFYSSIVSQAMIIQLTVFAYIGFLIHFKPYVERDHTLADVFCQICSVLTLSCGILFFTNNTKTGSFAETLSVITIGITCLCVLAAIIFVGKDLRRGTKTLSRKIVENEKRKSIQSDGAKSVKSATIKKDGTIKKEATLKKNLNF